MGHRDDEGKRVKFGAGLINDGPKQQRNDAVISTQELGGSSSSENHGASSSSSSYQMPPYPRNERRKMLFRYGRTGSRRYRPVCIPYETGGQCTSGDKCPFRHENPIPHRLSALEAGNTGPLKPPEDQSVKTLYIVRLNSSVLEQDIRDRFCPYGEIESIRLFDQIGVTCALLTYTTRQAAEKAMLELSASVVDINGQNLGLLWGPNQDTCNRFLAGRALLAQQQRMDPERNDAVISTQELGGSSSSEKNGASSSSYQMPPYPRNERRKMLFRYGRTGSRRYRPVCIPYETGGQCTSGDKCPFRHENPIPHRLSALEAGNTGPLKPPEDQSVKTLYIVRLNSSVLEQDIRDRFCPYGEIESIRLFDQIGVTCALLTYTTRQAAEKAMLELSASVVDINGQNLGLLWGPNQDTCNRFLAGRALLAQQQRMDPERNDAVISTQELGGSSSSEKNGASSYQKRPHPPPHREECEVKRRKIG